MIVTKVNHISNMKVVHSPLKGIQLNLPYHLMVKTALGSACWKVEAFEGERTTNLLKLDPGTKLFSQATLTKLSTSGIETCLYGRVTKEPIYMHTPLCFVGMFQVNVWREK